MNWSMRLMIFICLFYICWLIGITFQAVSTIIFGTKFGIVSRTSIGFLCVLLFYVYWFHIYWIHKKLPYVPVKYPYIFGSVSSYTHLAEKFADVYKSYRTDYPIIGISLLLEPVILITDLKLARSVLNEHFSYFQDRGMYQNRRDDPLSTVLGSLNYNEWNILRKKLTPAFTILKIKQMFSMINRVGDELVNGLNQIVATKNQVEIRCVFSRFATKIIGSAIGIQCDSSEFQKITQKAMQPYLPFPLNILTITNPNLARYIGIRKHPKEVSDFFVSVIGQTIQTRMKNHEHPNDFLQMLIDSELTKKEIAALAFDFLSAGYADATSTLSYCLFELALPDNKEIQEMARNEVERVFKQHTGEVTNDVLDKMVYCKSIIKGNFYWSYQYSLNSAPFREKKNSNLKIINDYHYRNAAKAPSCGKHNANHNKTVQSSRH